MMGPWRSIHRGAVRRGLDAAGMVFAQNAGGHVVFVGVLGYSSLT